MLFEENFLTNKEVSTLLKKFDNKDNFYYWKIGTSVYNILGSFYRRVNDNLDSFYDSPVLGIRSRNFGHEDYFSLFLKDPDINITPASLNKLGPNSSWVSGNALLQFLKVLVSFNSIQVLGSKLHENATKGDFFASLYTLKVEDFKEKDFDEFVRYSFNNLARNARSNYCYSRIFCYGIAVNYIAHHIDKNNVIVGFKKTNRISTDYSVKELLARPDGYDKFIPYVDEMGMSNFSSCENFIRKCVPNEEN